MVSAKATQNRSQRLGVAVLLTERPGSRVSLAGLLRRVADRGHETGGQDALQLELAAPAVIAHRQALQHVQAFARLDHRFRHGRAGN
jgi:hypothetical protein